MTTPTFAPPVRFNRAEFAIRPMTAADRPAVEAIAAQVWDGDDYVPRVFDDWLADDSGLFCAGVLGERLAALAKLTHLGGDQWWMEGLRVDPAFRGLGVARIMHHYVVNYARRYAPGLLRFSTASENAAIIRLAAETGFQQAAAFVAYGAAADGALASTRLVALSAAEVDRAWARLTTLPTFAAAQRTLEEGWRFPPLTPDVLHERLAAGRVYGWLAADHADRLAGLAILNAPRGAHADDDDDAPAGDMRLYVGFADAVAEEFTGLALALRGLAARQGAGRVSWKVLDDPVLITRLEAAGYESRWPMRVLLFARELALTDRAEARAAL